MSSSNRQITTKYVSIRHADIATPPIGSVINDLRASCLFTAGNNAAEVKALFARAVEGGLVDTEGCAGCLLAKANGFAQVAPTAFGEVLILHFVRVGHTWRCICKVD